MQRIFILALFLSASIPSFSQFDLERNAIYGGNSSDEARDIATNPPGSFLFYGGRSFSSDGNLPGNEGASDYWIMKRNLDGTLVWSKNYGGPGNDDLVTVMPHTDGGTFAFGTTHTDQGVFGDILGLAGGWIIRTNANGTIIDGKIFGGFTTETAVDAVRHVNGDITMVMEAGSTNLNGQMNHGLLDLWAVHVNASLTIEWTSLLGTTGTDVPTAVATDPNGNIYIAAKSDTNLPGLPPNKGGDDIWIIKLSPTGTLLWQKTYGGSSDDIPTDILFHPDGFIYISIESKSSDGTFDINEGINDLWLLKLDIDDGSPLGLKHYGGSGNEFDARLDLFGAHHLVITSTSTSDDGNLTGNKGLSDIWVMTTDLDGIITQQMNYGGSLNDLNADVMAKDSIFYILGSSLSSDKNVPSNSLSQMDMWAFTLNTRPEPCSEEFVCEMDTSHSNELFPLDDNSLLCVSGCTAGLPPGPDFNGGNCPDFTQPTAYFKLRTDTLAELLTLSVSSNEFNKPRIAIFRTNNCTTYQQVFCASGEYGSVLLAYLEILPKTNYVLAISDEEGNLGEFELCVSTLNVDFCNEGDRLFVTQTSLGSPLNGPYKPGEQVQICYELYDWNKLDCNGFQGLIPTFGPGWDSTGFDLFGEPLQIDSMLSPVETGFWDWYKVGDVHYNVSNPVNGYDGGQGMPAGWYFTNTGDPPPHDNPDQTTGDINDCLPTPDKWKVCFTLPVKDECLEDLDCSISMKTFADGELGIDPSLACVYDQEEIFTAKMKCCINPTLVNILDFEVCSGDTIQFTPETNLLPPVTYTWTVDPDPFIQGATSGFQDTSFYQILTTTAVIPLRVRYSLRAESDGCITGQRNFEVTVNPKPTAQINSSGPTTVCSGSTVNITFQCLGTPPFQIGLYRDNEPFANILSENNFISVPVDPVFSSRLRIGTLEDANCEGTGNGFVDVIIKPVNTEVIDTTICAGESVIVGNTEFDESGTYMVTLNNGSANNCDSIIHLTLSVIPILTESLSDVICHGDTLFVHGIPFTETTQELVEYIGPEGCPGFVNLDLLVKDTFSMDIFQTICFGDTLLFEGLKVYLEGDYAHTEEIRPGCFEETILHLDVLPAIVINDLEILSDDGNNNGGIILEIVGGSPPFTFLWNTGQSTESLFNIKHGHYVLTVTDRNGCDQVFEFDVPFMTATAEPSPEKVLECRPTIVKSNDKVRIYNSSPELIAVSSLEWWNLNGQRLASAENIIISGESYYSGQVPEGLKSGMYLLSARLLDGRNIKFRIIIE